MKKLILLLNILLFCFCFSQKRISLKHINSYLLKNNFVSFGLLDSIELKGMKDAITSYRLFGAKTCNINIDKKYSNIYIEDGFNEYADYDGIIIIDNKNICEITTNQNKLKININSFTKVEEKKDLYVKKIPVEKFQKDYPNEYFRYQVVAQNKVEDLKKCLAIDEHLPKPYIYAVSYYFANKKINNYGILKINYNDVKDGIEGFPDLTKEKEKEFIDCVNSLGISMD